MGVRVVTVGQPFRMIPLSTKTLMREIGLLARERVIRRTLSGQSSEGGAFRPYSKGYAIQKVKALGSASPVNLQASGDMLNSIVLADLTDKSVTLKFSR